MITVGSVTRENASELASNFGPKLPVPLSEDALVVSDNGNIYGVIKDLRARLQ